MPYDKTNWVEGSTKLGPTNLNHIEDGIGAAPYGPDAATGTVPVGDGAGGWIYKTYAQLKTALGLTSSDVGLGNVTNDAQLKASQLDTDGTLAANSDTKVASQKATKTYVDAGRVGVFNVTAYGADPTGVASSVAAFNNAWAALVAYVGNPATSGAKLYVPPGSYLLDGLVTWQIARDVFEQIEISGYGATCHMTTSSSGIIVSNNGFRWRYMLAHGLQCKIDHNSAFGFRFWDNNIASGYLAFFVVRMLEVMQGTATAPTCHGIEFYNQATANTIYQGVCDDCTASMPTNITGIGIYAHQGSGSAGISSFEVKNPNTVSCLIGVQLGDSGKAIPGGRVIGGTCLGAYNENVRMYVLSGKLDCTHCEGAWGTAPTGSRGAEIYLEGHATIIEPDLVVNSAVNVTSGSPTAGQGTCGISVFQSSGGPTTIIGRHGRVIPAITGAADNGAGLIRITCVGHGYATNNRIVVDKVGGVPEANEQWLITVIDADHFDLQGSAFVATSSYTSGGIARRCTVRILAASTAAGACVNIVNIPSKEIDYSLVTTAGQPTFSCFQPQTVNTPTYPATASGIVTADLDLGSVQFITVTDSNNFTVNPTNSHPGACCTLVIFNNSGGAMGTVTLAAAFQKVTAVTSPASTKKRTLAFVGDTVSGTILIETGRSTGDI
jgi:hypothetical protein